MLAIIPARGGSRGLPRKNIKLLAGRPLIDYTISAALAATRIDRVIVSTEDDEIAGIARQCGAEVPFMRPPELATDTMPNGTACLHVIDGIAGAGDKPRSAFALIQATSPFLAASDIDAAVDLFEQRQPAAVVSLRTMETPIEAIFELDPEGRMRPVLAARYGIAFENAQRQHYGKRYAVAGAVTVVRTDPLRADPNYYFQDPQSLGYPLDELAGLDIDTAIDFALAEMLMLRRQGEPDQAEEL